LALLLACLCPVAHSDLERHGCQHQKEHYPRQWLAFVARVGLAGDKQAKHLHRWRDPSATAAHGQTVLYGDSGNGGGASTSHQQSCSAAAQAQTLPCGVVPGGAQGAAGLSYAYAKDGSLGVQVGRHGMIQGVGNEEPVDVAGTASPAAALPARNLTVVVASESTGHTACGPALAQGAPAVKVMPQEVARHSQAQQVRTWCLGGWVRWWRGPRVSSSMNIAAHLLARQCSSLAHGCEASKV
jgi:hypothetical protein